MSLGNLVEKGISFLKDKFQPNETNKTVFITGCSTGIGRATAIGFAQQGWNVVATMRNTANANGFEKYGNISVVELDVTNITQIEKALETAEKQFGKVEVVVNNAGICVFGALEHVAESNIDKQWNVNVRGTINVTRAFIPHFKKNGKGMFINISSIAGLSTNTPVASLYSMSKFAVEGFTEGLYYELKPLNIDVHLVEPGSYKTAIAGNTIFDYDPHTPGYDGIVAKMKSVFDNADSFERGDPSEVAAAVFLIATGKSKKFRTVMGKDAEQTMAFRNAVPIEEYLSKTAGFFK
jgi:NAD(P)-dependent dehydrogenase (short-subunit alcohol dehydrogenase family)